MTLLPSSAHSIRNVRKARINKVCFSLSKGRAINEAHAWIEPGQCSAYGLFNLLIYFGLCLKHVVVQVTSHKCLHTLPPFGLLS